MTGRTRLLLVTGAMALTLAVQAQVQDRPELLLQAAIKKELVEGDLKGAIELFKQIAQDSNPEVAAEALLHLAASYDKLGQAEARNTYERIVREYPNQKKAVAEARAWLEAHRGTKADGAVRLEQVWTGPGVDLEGRVSPDGRYLSFADWTSGPANLAVRDLKTGENRLLTRDATWEGYAAESLVSPDGKQIAYRWEDGKNISIRLIGIDGKHARVLAKREYGLFLSAWSPDGKSIAGRHYNLDDKTIQIVLLSIADGSMTQLKSVGSRDGSGGGFSPDGRFLVYSLAKDPQAGNGGVFALAVDGSRETPLVQDSANNSNPVWSPDGRRVVFVSDRSGTNGLWSIRVADGQPQGSPELLQPNIGNITSLGFAGDGAYYYGAQSRQTDAYTVEIDAHTLRVTQPTPLMDRFVGLNFEPELSPDGRYVAFLRRPSEALAGGPASLIVRSSRSGEERTLVNLDLVYSGDRNVQWFPDSRSVLLQSTTASRKTFRQINVETGEARVLFEGPYAIWRTTALSPDGRTLFYSIFERGSQSNVGTLRLVTRQLETGEEKELYRTQSDGVGCFGLTISSDGSRLAFSVNVADRKRALMIMPADGGTPREIYRAGYGGLSPQGAMIWSRDGRYIIAGAECGRDERLCAIPVDGGDLKPLGLTMPQVLTPMLSADGRRIAFTGAAPKRELWLIRNLLTEPAEAR